MAIEEHPEDFYELSRLCVPFKIPDAMARDELEKVIKQLSGIPSESDNRFQFFPKEIIKRNRRTRAINEDEERRAGEDSEMYEDPLLQTYVHPTEGGEIETVHSTGSEIDGEMVTPVAFPPIPNVSTTLTDHLTYLDEQINVFGNPSVWACTSNDTTSGVVFPSTMVPKSGEFDIEMVDSTGSTVDEDVVPSAFPSIQNASTTPTGYTTYLDEHINSFGNPSVWPSTLSDTTSISAFTSTLAPTSGDLDIEMLDSLGTIDDEEIVPLASPSFGIGGTTLSGCSATLAGLDEHTSSFGSSYTQAWTSGAANSGHNRPFVYDVPAMRQSALDTMQPSSSSLFGAVNPSTNLLSSTRQQQVLPYVYNPSENGDQQFTFSSQQHSDCAGQDINHFVQESAPLYLSDRADYAVEHLASSSQQIHYPSDDTPSTSSSASNPPPACRSSPAPPLQHVDDPALGSYSSVPSSSGGQTIDKLPTAKGRPEKWLKKVGGVPVTKTGKPTGTWKGYAVFDAKKPERELTCLMEADEWVHLVGGMVRLYDDFDVFDGEMTPEQYIMARKQNGLRNIVPRSPTKR